MEPAPINTPNPDSLAGAAVYTRGLLSTYDLVVLGLSSRFLWRCPAAEVLALYDKHVTGNHLDVGVGTGYFLDRCRFPTPKPRLALVDLNSNSLVHAAGRVSRYAPSAYLADVLAPLPLPAPGFDSIGVNYLLHCLPGTIESKAIAFDHLGAHLNPGGVLFGSTILGPGASTSAVARTLMRLYNGRGIFCNMGDTLAGLRTALEVRFARVSIRQVGSVALFIATDEATTPS